MKKIIGILAAISLISLTANTHTTPRPASASNKLLLLPNHTYSRKFHQALRRFGQYAFFPTPAQIAEQKSRRLCIKVKALSHKSAIDKTITAQYLKYLKETGFFKKPANK